MNLLVAALDDGSRVEAARDLPAGEYICPMCEAPVTLKRGRVRVSHFAHAPNSDCPGSEPESWRHLLAKRVLVEEIASYGWQAQVEVAHPSFGRRVDVDVTVPANGRWHRIAVEVQDSAIQVDTMKARVAADRRIGYSATAWLFTTHRAAALMAVAPEHEVRVPDEMLWVANRYGQGVPIIDPENRDIWLASFGSVHREGTSLSWYTSQGELTGVDYPGRSLQKTKTVDRRRAGFRLLPVPGKYSNELAVTFIR
ncbi:competence protein CoiA [Actinacidiphila glaucinigra]|uniref:competence protein CoiA n=1 Tax=Actinacidiphila glaucinigra TaxID=235986 RepID=UPI00378C7A4C